MKKNISEFVTNLSNGDFSVLEDIFENKYRKFLSVYWMICNYSNNIKSLEYKKTKKDKLKINLTVDINPLEILDNINNSISEDNVNIKCEKNTIYIIINGEE